MAGKLSDDVRKRILELRARKRAGGREGPGPTSSIGLAPQAGVKPKRRAPGRKAAKSK